MTYQKLLLAIFILLLSVNGCVKIDEIEKSELKVKQTLEKFSQAVNENDVKTVVFLFHKDSSSVLLFPGEQKQIRGWDEIKWFCIDKFKTVESIKILQGNEIIQLSPDLNTAWVTSVRKVQSILTEEKIEKLVNMSAVLVKRGGVWFFSQLHLSVATSQAGEVEDKIIATMDSAIVEGDDKNLPSDESLQDVPGDTLKIEKTATAKQDTAVKKNNEKPDYVN